jgi:hypothetical protein
VTVQKFANVSFEVESVKEKPLSRGEAGRSSLSMSPSGLFVAARETALVLIMFAYDVRYHQIAGGPTWIALLADRFGLLVQKEMRVMPIYSLSGRWDSCGDPVGRLLSVLSRSWSWQ